PPPRRPPVSAVTAGSRSAWLTSSTSNHARRYDMPSARAAAEIDPVDLIASSNAILPGPMRSPFARSIRMERRVPDMMLHSPRQAPGSHADSGRIVKGHVWRLESWLEPLYSLEYVDDVKGRPP